MPTEKQPPTTKSKMLRRRIGITVQVLMQLRGISATELTRRTSWSVQSKTSRLLNGHASWRDADLAEIASILHVEIGVLFEAPEDALKHLGVPADVADALLSNALTPAERATAAELDITDWNDINPRFHHLGPDQQEWAAA